MSPPLDNEDGARQKEKLQHQVASSSKTSTPFKQSQKHQGHIVGLSWRLTKGAGTHLASWLQELSIELSNVTAEEAHSWLLLPQDPRTDEALDKVRKSIGNESLGHNNPILSSAH